MRNVKMETGFFTQNRKNLAKILKPGSIAIVNSNDIMPTNADGTMKFKQNSDLFYLSGIMQEESVLLLFPDSKSERNREILFIRDYNKDLEVWEGKKLSVEEARGISGIQRVEGLSHFDDVLQDLVVACENIYLNSNEHDRAKRTVEDRDVRFIRMVKERYPLHNYMRLAPLLYGLRELKQPVEIELTQKACDISGKGFDRILKFVKPGVYEYEIEAEYAHGFIKNWEGFAD
jgi:Xaa-Pro aminopeptidase